MRSSYRRQAEIRLIKVHDPFYRLLRAKFYCTTIKKYIFYFIFIITHYQFEALTGHENLTKAQSFNHARESKSGMCSSFLICIFCVAGLRQPFLYGSLSSLSSLFTLSTPQGVILIRSYSSISCCKVQTFFLVNPFR